MPAEKTGFAKSLQQAFRPLISTAVKTNLATAIKANDIDIVDLDQHLELISESLRVGVAPAFEEYGLTLMLQMNSSSSIGNAIRFHRLM